MCEHCGCTSDNEESRHRRMHEQGIPHEHEHRLTVEQNILSLNNSRAEENRSYFARRGICAVNMVSSPGAGKTSLLEQTLLSLSRDIPVAVIEGDQHTDNDTRRIEATGVTCLQINTAQGCHLRCRRSIWKSVLCCLSRMSVIWYVRRCLIWANRYGWLSSV